MGSFPSPPAKRLSRGPVSALQCFKEIGKQLVSGGVRAHGEATRHLSRATQAAACHLQPRREFKKTRITDDGDNDGADGDGGDYIPQVAPKRVQLATSNPH